MRASANICMLVLSSFKHWSSSADVLLLRSKIRCEIQTVFVGMRRLSDHSLGVNKNIIMNMSVGIGQTFIISC